MSEIKCAVALRAVSVACLLMALVCGPGRAQEDSAGPADAPADTSVAEAPAFTPDTRFKLAADPVFNGNEHFSDRRLRRMTGLAKDAEMPLYLKDDYARQIQTAYHDAGYPMAAVSAEMRGVEDVSVGVLHFIIAEGPRVAVSDIVFEGNESVEDDVLLDAMTLRERWTWLPIFRPGRFKRDAFDEDMRKVQSALYDLGYLDAVAGGEIVWNRERDRVQVKVVVHEGERYKVQGIVFEGNKLFRDDELLSAIPLAVGEPFRPADLEKALAEIEELYAAAGRPDCTRAKGNLSGVPVIAEEGALVTVRFRIVEGPLVRIGNIHVRGLMTTRENVVRRNLNFYPGQVATSTAFRESESLVTNTGAFDRSRNAVQIELAPGDEEVRDAIVRVKEGPTANLIFSGGLSSRDGIFGEVSFTEDNLDILNWPSSWGDLVRGNAFRGAGHKLRVRLYASQESTYYAISFLNPAVYDSIYSFGTELYSTSRNRRDYDEARAGGAVTGGMRITKFITHSITLGYENVEIDDIDGDAPADFLRDDGSHSRPYVRYTARTDRRDNRFVPSEGYFLQGLIEYAAGDVDVVKVVVDAEKYFLLFENEEGGRHVVAIKGRVGVADSTGNGRVPVFERLFAGGQGSIRGFEYDGVAPIDPPTGDQLGGESMLVGSVEYVFPVKAEALDLLLFVDGGYVQEDAEDVLSGWDELRVAVGVGARVSLGAAFPGNIEISVAVPVMKEDGDETEPFQFSIGAGARF